MRDGGDAGVAEDRLVGAGGRGVALVGGAHVAAEQRADRRQAPRRTRAMSSAARASQSPRSSSPSGSRAAARAAPAPGAPASAASSVCADEVAGCRRRERSAAPKCAGKSAARRSRDDRLERLARRQRVAAERAPAAGQQVGVGVGERVDDVGRAPSAWRRRADLDQASVHSGDSLGVEDPLEERGAQVALPGVGQHGDDGLAGVLGPLREPYRHRDRRAARDAREDALLAAQPARVGDGLLVADLLDRVDERQVEHLRHEARADALDLVRARLERLAGALSA